ncbi:MAG: dTDP-4-dehydrorhamnose 3,5-epimerase [Bacteroidetes bacterium]|jgi:dTDP-4-dehydrorhamnose 3,5-epimerase|nr:dTDP-4-dehydrorhamnose 3,5-epimerase [Bacteroidota bacterium]
MTVEPTSLPGVIVVVPDRHGDRRGSIVEVWRKERYQEAGIQFDFVQDNISRSVKGTLRGLHFQNPMSQAKLMTVLEGEVFDVAVDIRRGSPTFGRWVGVTLSGENRRQLLIPEGFAHGFQVVSEQSILLYKISRPYRPEYEHVVAWNDPELAIDWPVAGPLLSQRDAGGRALRAFEPEALTFAEPQ